ncbi:hypothetical protein ACIBBE_45960 [Streptomyces sp. NPDC051644]|uniref:scabin-related ADP-ribosyltransferase n=1 Tax=Streptomyces sp. NPDC051644 TaxID=3365666 RepID=UPI0037A65918
MPAVAGISGTALRMLRAFQWLGLPETEVADFRKALMGWMLPGQDHSLFEILRGSYFADTTSPEEDAALNAGITQLYRVPGLVPPHLTPPGAHVVTESADVPKGLDGLDAVRNDAVAGAREEAGDGTLAHAQLRGSGEVRTDRWIPFGSRTGERVGVGAFEFSVSADGKPTGVRRPAGSGERTEVGYGWVWQRGGSPVDDVVLLTRRVHLSAAEVGPAELSALRGNLAEALEEVINRPRYRLPAFQPDQVQVFGPKLPGPLLRVELEFVEVPDTAHTTVRVSAGLPGPGRAMVQGLWFTGVHAAAYVHEIVHGLGVRDDRADPRMLLTPGGRGEQALAEGESSLMGPFEDRSGPPRFVLTPDHLQQITDVLAPYVHAGGQIEAGPTRDQAVPQDRDTAGELRAETEPPVQYLLIHPADIEYLVESRPGETLWRFSNQAPETVFAQGFRADDVSQIADLETWSLDNPVAQFVSTTRDAELGFGRRFRYRIDAARNGDPTGADINATLKARGVLARENEKEVAFTRVVDREAVISVYDRNLDRTGIWDQETETVAWRPGGRYDWAEEETTVDSSPAVDYAMVHPDDADFLVESDPDETLWRFSGTAPEKIFAEGFRATNTSNRVTVHHWARDNPDSPYVATTRNRDLWLRIPYRYEIKAARNPDPTGVDVIATLDRRQLDVPYPQEQEVAFTGGISPRAIVRVYFKFGDRTGVWDADTRQVIWTPGDTNAPAALAAAEKESAAGDGRLDVGEEQPREQQQDQPQDQRQEQSLGQRQGPNRVAPRPLPTSASGLGAESGSGFADRPGNAGTGNRAGTPVARCGPEADPARPAGSGGSVRVGDDVPREARDMTGLGPRPAGEPGDRRPALVEGDRRAGEFAPARAEAHTASQAAQVRPVPAIRPDGDIAARAGRTLEQDQHFRAFLDTALRGLPHRTDTVAEVRPDTLAAAYAQLPPRDQDLSRPAQLAPRIAELLTYGRIPGLPGGTPAPSHRPEQSPREESDSDSSLFGRDEESPGPSAHSLALPTRATAGAGPVVGPDGTAAFRASVDTYRAGPWPQLPPAQGPVPWGDTEQAGDAPPWAAAHEGPTLSPAQRTLLFTQLAGLETPPPLGAVHQHITATTHLSLTPAALHRLHHEYIQWHQLHGAISGWSYDDILTAYTQYRNASDGNPPHPSADLTWPLNGHARPLPLGELITKIREGKTTGKNLHHLIARLEEQGASSGRKWKDEDFLAALRQYKKENENWKTELSQKRKGTFRGEDFPIGKILSNIRSGHRTVSPDFLKQIKDEGIGELDNAKTKKTTAESWKDGELLAALLQDKKENEKGSGRPRKIAWENEDILAALLQHQKETGWAGEKVSPEMEISFKDRVFSIGQILYEIGRGRRKLPPNIREQLESAGINLEKVKRGGSKSAAKKTRESWKNEEFLAALLQHKENGWIAPELARTIKIPFNGRKVPIGRLLYDIRHGDRGVSLEILDVLKKEGIGKLQNAKVRVEREGGKSAAVGAGDSVRPRKRPRGGQPDVVPPPDQPPTAKPSKPRKRPRRGEPDAVRGQPDAVRGEADAVLPPTQSPTNVSLPGENPDPAGGPDLTGDLDPTGIPELDLAGIPDWAGGSWFPNLDSDQGMAGGPDLAGGSWDFGGFPGLDPAGGSSDSGGFPGLDLTGGGLGLTEVPPELLDWILAWDAAGTLTDPQAQTLQERGLRAVDVPHDGDCFFHALLRSGVLRDGVTAGDVRSVLARELSADLERSPQVLWPQLDAQGQSGTAADQFPSLTNGMTPQENDVYRALLGEGPADRNDILTGVTASWSNTDRNRIIASLETSGVYDDASGDIAPLAAAWIYGLRINVITPEGFLYTIGPDNGRVITLIRQDRSSGLPHDHWLATEESSAFPT